MNIQFPTAQEQKVSSIWNSSQALAAEGSIYIASNPTPGTGLAGTICADDAATASSTHAQFAPFLLCQNGWSSANPNAKTIYPLAIRLTTSLAPANAAEWNIAIRLDPVTAKYSSGGTQLTPQNVNTNFSNQSGASVYAGAVVPTGIPTAASKLFNHTKISTVIPLFGDTYMLVFGSLNMDVNMLFGGATARAISAPVAPMAISPGWAMQLEMWGSSSLTTAGQWEVDFIYAER